MFGAWGKFHFRSDISAVLELLSSRWIPQGGDVKGLRGLPRRPLIIIGDHIFPHVLLWNDQGLFFAASQVMKSTTIAKQKQKEDEKLEKRTSASSNHSHQLCFIWAYIVISALSEYHCKNFYDPEECRKWLSLQSKGNSWSGERHDILICQAMLSGILTVLV